jgi:hypothetical protein
MAKRYDPERPPAANAWLALSEDKRLALVAAYHRRVGIRPPNPRLHAVLHTIVENQIAEHVVEAERALERLMAQGLDRHDAVHAIGWVLIEQFIDAREATPPRVDLGTHDRARLQTLTAQEWLFSAQSEPS